MKYQKYDNYKDSGIDWLGRIPEHWVVSRLKFLGNSVIGLTYDPEEIVDNSDEGTLVLRANNIQDGKLVDNNPIYVNKIIPPKLKLNTGDILICSRNGSRHLVGKNAVITQSFENSSFGAFMTVFRSKYWNYLSKVLHSEIFTSQSNLYLTTTINQLTISTLNNLLVPFPTDEKERETITNFLDKEVSRIDTLIEKKQQFIVRLKEKRLAVISNAVTKGINADAKLKPSGIDWLGDIPEHWEVKKLKFNVLKVGSGITPSGGSSAYLEEGIPLIRSQNVYSDGLRLKDVVYIDSDTHLSMSNSMIKPKDVLLNITGASLGRSYYVEENIFDEANVNQHVCIIRPNQNLYYRFLHLLMISESGQTQIWNNQTGSGREGLNFEAIKNFIFAFPPATTEQISITKTIESELKRIDELLTKTELALSKLEEYKTSLISSAVTGKIKVTESA